MRNSHVGSFSPYVVLQGSEETQDHQGEEGTSVGPTNVDGWLTTHLAPANARVFFYEPQGRGSRIRHV